LLWSHHIFTPLHALASAHHMIQNDQLGKRQGIALALNIAHVETPQEIQAVGAKMADLLHICPDTILELACLLMSNSSIDLQHISLCPSICPFNEPQSWSTTILRYIQHTAKIDLGSVLRLKQTGIQVR
jgi:hypothetical protein